MGVHADEERPVYAAALPMEADGLGDRQDVRFVEGALEADPRWPDVPKDTRCDAIEASGTSAK
jgi:hypothetical protein